MFPFLRFYRSWAGSGSASRWSRTVLFNRMPQLRKNVNAPSTEIGQRRTRTFNAGGRYDNRKKKIDGGLGTDVFPVEWRVRTVETRPPRRARRPRVFGGESLRNPVCFRENCDSNQRKTLFPTMSIEFEDTGGPVSRAAKNPTLFTARGYFNPNVGW
jgi:hypothetical protein